MSLHSEKLTLPDFFFSNFCRFRDGGSRAYFSKLNHSRKLPKKSVASLNPVTLCPNEILLTHTPGISPMLLFILQGQFSKTNQMSIPSWFHCFRFFNLGSLKIISVCQLEFLKLLFLVEMSFSTFWVTLGKIFLMKGTLLYFSWKIHCFIKISKPVLTNATPVEGSAFWYGVAAALYTLHPNKFNSGQTFQFQI